jgi:hypothetical protein
LANFGYDDRYTESEPVSLNLMDIEDQLQRYYWVPVALVIQTKVEFHDAFKLILKAIYESFKIDTIAFAEVIAHIALLRTIPAPVFNSEVNLLFFDTFINIKENSFNELPHKNQNSIKILIEVLDFRTILKCIRGLLFDYTLIVMSQETSLLFQVIEGLKQLMFPFTVDFEQFLPANQNYADQNGNTLLDLFHELEGM